MPLADHLVELRTRLIVCIAAALLGMIVAYVFYDDVFYPIIRAPLDVAQGNETGNPFVVRTPLLKLLGGGSAAGEGEAAPVIMLNYTSVTVPLMVRLKVSLVVGMLLALPVIAYEIWMFVSSGLYEHERRLVAVFGPASFALFFVGVAVAYFGVLPIGVAFLIKEGNAIGLKPILTVNEYAPFVMWLLLGFGLIFQTPLVILFLTRIGLVNPQMLGRSRRYAILAVFIIAAVLTPPDVFTQIAMATPMIALYELSIFLSRWRRARPAARSPVPPWT